MNYILSVDNQYYLTNYRKSVPAWYMIIYDAIIYDFKFVHTTDDSIIFPFFILLVYNLYKMFPIDDNKHCIEY